MRAIVGAIALYALLLQAFLASATPSEAALTGHVICAPQGDGQAGSPDKPLRHDHQCCTAVHLGNIAPPSTDTSTTIGWQPSRETRILWRPEADCPRTGPPTHAHSARGPPQA